MFLPELLVAAITVRAPLWQKVVKVNNGVNLRTSKRKGGDGRVGSVVYKLVIKFDVTPALLGGEVKPVDTRR